MKYNLPIELKYTTSHEWAKIEKDIAIMGITDFAQHQLGDIVFVELPEIGATFERGDSIGEIESVKAVDEFFMPVSGEIIENNEKIKDNPELVNSSPYIDGWFVKIKINKFSEINALLSTKQYEDLLLKEEEK
jgi:glycine cleavage system H protein